MRVPKRLKEQRGQFFFLLLVTVVIILGIVGLAVDGGNLYFRWTGLSRALDAACVAVIKKAPEMTDAEILDTAEKVAAFNLQQQGADITKFIFSGQVTRRPEFVKLIKVKLTGTLTDIPSVLIKLIPGNASAPVKDNTKCPTCYNNPEVFVIPVGGLYQGGMACQKICNDGTFRVPDTMTCCAYAHMTTLGASESDCMCSYSATMDQLTSCDPDAQGPMPVDPENPGISGPVWINRPDSDALGMACVAKCAETGKIGQLLCNEDCREETGTVCCRCRCLDAGDCNCDSPDDIIRCPLECGTHCNNGTCESGETCETCPSDCGSCPVDPPTCTEGTCTMGACPSGQTAVASIPCTTGPLGIFGDRCCKEDENECTDNGGMCCGNPTDCSDPMPGTGCGAGTCCNQGNCEPPNFCTSGTCTFGSSCPAGNITVSVGPCSGPPVGVTGGACCQPNAGSCVSNADCSAATPNCCFALGAPTGVCQTAPCTSACPANYTCQISCPGGPAGSGGPCTTNTGVPGVCCLTNPPCTAGTTCTAAPAGMITCSGGVTSTGQCSTTGTGPIDGICCPPPGPSCLTPGFTCQTSCGSGMTGSPPAGGYCPTGTQCCPPSCTAGSTCTPGAAGTSCPGGFPSSGPCSTSGTAVDGICCPPSGNPCTAPNICQTACGTGGAGIPPSGGYCPQGTMCCSGGGTMPCTATSCGPGNYCCAGICQSTPCTGTGCPIKCEINCTANAAMVGSGTISGYVPSGQSWDQLGGCTCVQGGGGTCTTPLTQHTCDPMPGVDCNTQCSYSALGNFCRGMDRFVGPNGSLPGCLQVGVAVYPPSCPPPPDNPAACQLQQTNCPACPGGCPSGTMCVAGACTPGCVTSATCPSGQTCTNGQCMPSVPSTCPNNSTCMASCPVAGTSVGACSMGGPAMPIGSCCPNIPTCTGNSICSTSPCDTSQGYTQASAGPCSSAQNTPTPTGSYCCTPPPSTCPSNSTCLASCPVAGTSLAFCSMGGPAMPTGSCCPYINMCPSNSICSLPSCSPGYTQTSSGPCASGPDMSVPSGNYCCTPPPACPTNSYCSGTPCSMFPGHPSVRSGPCSTAGPAMPVGVDCCLI